MKRKVILMILLVMTGLKLFSQPAIQWASNYNGSTNGNDIGLKIAIDNNGNTYVTGTSVGKSSYTHYLTIKYNDLGDTVWTKPYGGIYGNDKPYDLKVDASGNVYITGKSMGNGTGYDIVTIKYDSNGVVKWNKTFSGSAKGEI